MPPVSPAILRPTVARVGVGLLVTAVTAFVLGGLTSFGQALLPSALSSLANSASGWTVLTVLLVWLLRRGPRPSALYGAASFVALVLGYQVVAGWRGYVYDPTFWVVVGAVAGPFVGVAASWLGCDGWRAAAGTALLAGIGAGEAVYGLTRVAGTTSPVYWAVVGVAALLLVAATLVRARRDPVATTLTAVGTAAVAGAFFVAYSAL